MENGSKLDFNGFSRYTFIGGPADLVQQGERLAWLQQAVKQHGLKLQEKLIKTADLTSTGGG